MTWAISKSEPQGLKPNSNPALNGMPEALPFPAHRRRVSPALAREILPVFILPILVLPVLEDHSIGDWQRTTGNCSYGF
jgi:hypothetical protein